MSVSVVSATWNERETLPTLIKRINQALGHVPHEIIIVDDSSPDETYMLASELADKAIRKKREGQSIALLVGIREAKYPIVVTIDADLENDPSNILTLVEALQEGYDIVVAVRLKLPRFSERLFAATIGKRIGVSDVLSNFRAMRTDHVRDIVLGWGETFGAEFLIRAHRLGLRIGQVQVPETPRRSRPRIGGTVKSNVRILKALVVSLIIMLRTQIAVLRQGDDPQRESHMRIKDRVQRRGSRLLHNRYESWNNRERETLRVPADQNINSLESTSRYAALALALRKKGVLGIVGQVLDRSAQRDRDSYIRVRLVY